MRLGVSRLPDLVEMTITPLRARAPYIEVADASFSTCISSISVALSPAIAELTKVTASPETN